MNSKGTPVKLPGRVKGAAQINPNWANQVNDALKQLRDRGIPQKRRPIAASPFRHFDIQVRNESGTWKGYVGNGALMCSDSAISGGFELFKQADVTHEGASIKLDLATHPFETGIADLVDDNDGTTLSDSSTYYVYLKVTFQYAMVLQNNEIITGRFGTVASELFSSAVTSFETSIQAEGTTSNQHGEDDVVRWYLLGTVVTPAGDTGATVQKLHHGGAIYWPLVQRGRTIESRSDAKGGSNINANSDGELNCIVVSDSADNDLTASNGAYYDDPVNGLTGGTGITVSETDGDWEITNTNP